VPGSSSGGIFLSYRRQDAAPYARLLQYQLSERFPDAHVFMDLDSVEAGLDFAEVIRDAVGSSSVLVALIGRQWATVSDEEGRRRLDDPDDYVRFEVQTALERGVRVIPVLVDDARPLRQQQLPAELHKLARLNALELSYGRYQYDSDRLLELIQRVLAATGDRAESERQAQARRPGPAARPPGRRPDSRPTAVPPGPQALAATLTHGSRWLTVHAVVFSPDGHLLASGLEDARIQLWDSTTGQQLRTLTPDATFWSEMTGPVHAVVFSPDGRLLASAGGDDTVRLWDPATGRHERTLTGHARGIWGVVFSPDGRLLASASDDKTVRLWHPATDQDGRTLRGPLMGHAGWVRSVVFSPDGRLLASASDDKTVRLWHPATGRHERTLTGHTGPVRSVAFSPDGRLLASAGDDGTVRLWR